MGGGELTKHNGHIIQATKMPTILHVIFPNGRTMQAPINPVETKLAKSPDGRD